ncbi:MAG: hypothetical protein ACI4S4_02140 [Candidatus Ornithospirochaeta sp.]
MDNNRAIYAGERALGSLNEARNVLSGAKTWGFMDIIFGHSGFTGFMKHSNIDKARRVLDEARRDLMEFRDELKYLPQVDINIDGFLTFADFFFDGFIVDVIVQSRINDTIRQLDEAISRTRQALSALRLV